MKIGYWLSSEEHSPKDLVENAKRAEAAGFDHVLISDHIHPWVDEQGHSPFVWGVLGAIAEATERIQIGTAVTCPLIRMHPAIVAHATATAQSLFDGRFFLGVGTGENLNEHVLGDRWPRADERLEMLEEAVELIKKLLAGDYESYRGKHYTVEQLKLYDAPKQAAPVIVAAKAENAARLAAAIGDGTMNTTPDEEIVKIYKDAGGTGPIYGKVTGAFAASLESARKIGKERQPNIAMGGDLSTELALPRDFAAVAELVRDDDLEESLVLGNDPAMWREGIDEYERAGFTHAALHDVSADQAEFIEFAKQFI
ncbi:MAG: TIGR03557 family F420-dependent LLM class oxidoreductase [Actinobacteria bacterium]|nr:TIGR03557 family F420-dependent LLM class oxidoreductase [Actinomycetota bacterium]